MGRASGGSARIESLRAACRMAPGLSAKRPAMLVHFVGGPFGGPPARARLYFACVLGRQFPEQSRVVADVPLAATLPYRKYRRFDFVFTRREWRVLPKGRARCRWRDKSSVCLVASAVLRSQRPRVWPSI